MKTCPRCKNTCFDEMDTCFECFYHFDHPESFEEPIISDWEEPSMVPLDSNKQSKPRISNHQSESPLYLRIEIPWDAVMKQAIEKAKDISSDKKAASV